MEKFTQVVCGCGRAGCTTYRDRATCCRSHHCTSLLPMVPIQACLPTYGPFLAPVLVRLNRPTVSLLLLIDQATNRHDNGKVAAVPLVHTTPYAPHHLGVLCSSVCIGTRLMSKQEKICVAAVGPTHV